MLTVMVTGGRDYKGAFARRHVFETLDRLHAETPITEILHGACGWNGDEPSKWNEKTLRGADALADEWARERRVRVLRKPAHWTKLGHGAGPRRNGEMVARRPDRVVVFPGGDGTANAMKLARAAGLRILDARDEGEE